MIYVALSGSVKEYESICMMIEHKMDSVHEMSFDDFVFKFVSFDDKLHVFNQCTEVNPHLAFTDVTQTETKEGEIIVVVTKDEVLTPTLLMDEDFISSSLGRYVHSTVRFYNKFNQDDTNSEQQLHNVILWSIMVPQIQLLQLTSQQHLSTAILRTICW